MAGKKKTNKSIRFTFLMKTNDIYRVDVMGTDYNSDSEMKLKAAQVLDSIRKGGSMDVTFTSLPELSYAYHPNDWETIGSIDEED